MVLRNFECMTFVIFTSALRYGRFVFVNVSRWAMKLFSNYVHSRCESRTKTTEKYHIAVGYSIRYHLLRWSYLLNCSSLMYLFVKRAGILLDFISINWNLIIFSISSINYLSVKFKLASFWFCMIPESIVYIHFFYL